MTTLVKFVPTTLSFYPSYTCPTDQREHHNRYVRVFCLKYPGNNGYKVGVRGMDDYGWDFETHSKREALREWRSIERIDEDFTKHRKGWIHG